MMPLETSPSRSTASNVGDTFDVPITGDVYVGDPADANIRALAGMVAKDTAVLNDPGFYVGWFGGSVLGGLGAGAMDIYLFGGENLPALAGAETGAIFAVPGGPLAVWEFGDGFSSPGYPIGEGPAAWLGYLVSNLTVH